MSEKEENYISLKEAAKHCQYSQEYLSLRARQGKLKATKIGRNWATTKEWVKEYEKRMEAYKKGEEYKPEKKKKTKKKEKKKKEVIKVEQKSSSNLKDHLVLLLTGAIIGIVISALVINFVLIYKFSGFGVQTENVIKERKTEVGNKIIEFSYVTNRKAFNNLKKWNEKVVNREDQFKEGLAYFGDEMRNLITRNSYQAASKAGKVELALNNFSKKIYNQTQLAAVNFEKEEKKDKKKIISVLDKAQTTIEEFVYSLAFYSNSLAKSSKKVLREKLFEADKNLREIITRTNLDIRFNTIKFIASMDSIRQTTKLFGEYKNWFKNNLIN